LREPIRLFIRHQPDSHLGVKMAEPTLFLGEHDALSSSRFRGPLLRNFLPSKAVGPSISANTVLYNPSGFDPPLEFFLLSKPSVFILVCFFAVKGQKERRLPSLFLLLPFVRLVPLLSLQCFYLFFLTVLEGGPISTFCIFPGSIPRDVSFSRPSDVFFLRPSVSSFAETPS